MHMAATKPWTLEELDLLPEDGNKYELVHGELFMTPAPTYHHETIAARLARLLDRYAEANDLGLVYRPRSIVQRRGSRGEPDIMVREAGVSRISWDDVSIPILVAEILSPSSRRRERERKRAFYIDDLKIPHYWIVDPAKRVITIVSPGRPDVVCAEAAEWHPSGAGAPLVVDVQRLFD